MFKKNVTFYLSNKIKTINHNDFIHSGILIHPWPHVSCEFGNHIQRTSHINDSSKRGKKRLIVKKVQCVRKCCVIFSDTLYKNLHVKRSQSFNHMP